MLRAIFVGGIILLGVIYMFQGPFFALLFYLWYAYFRPEQWVWYDFVSPLNLSFVVGVLLLASSLPALRTYRLTAQTSLILLFLGQSTISLMVSGNFDWSVTFWIEFLKVIIVTLLMGVLVTDTRRYRLVLLVIGYSLGLEQAKQGWAMLVLHPGATNNNPHPVLGDNNGVATGMMMLAPVFVALAQTATRRWEKYFHRFMVAGVLYRGISTYSRGGLLAAVAIGVVALWRSPRRIRALISVAVLAAVIWNVMPQSFWDRMGTIMAPEEQREALSEGRTYFWRLAVQMANDHPITGVGFNDFRHALAAYDTTAAYGEERAVHSAWFGVLSEMGYPGLILFVSIVLLALRSTWVVRSRTRGDPTAQDLRAFASGMQMSLVAFIVGMTFLTGQYNEMFWHFTGLCVALEWICEARLRESAASAVALRNPGVVPRPTVAMGGLRNRPLGQR